MISTMRPDIDNMDEYVRNTTARAFAVVASALGIPSLLPFLKAVCKSKKSWQARHTGIKIVQQIAILMGCAILPHLKNLVEIIEHGKLPVTEVVIFNHKMYLRYLLDIQIHILIYIKKNPRHVMMNKITYNLILLNHGCVYIKCTRSNISKYVVNYVLKCFKYKCNILKHLLIIDM